MEVLHGFGMGLMASGALFLVFVLAIQLIKNPNPKVLAASLIALEVAITIVGIAITSFVMWKWKS